ncbi:MAG: protein-L-isoaspartate(D-aspartate) O-methyltransferase [Planctomycetota bacterium]
MQPPDVPQDRSAERERMVSHQLVRRGIRAPGVLAAMRRIPRELFVAPGYESRAYEDSALAISHGQTISQPYMVARMTELLELRAQDRVLEIGTGTGYQTAVLAILAGQVYTIERLADLSQRAAILLNQIGITNVTYHQGDGSLGWPEEMQFEAIIVTAGAPEIPPPLCRQLTANGRLVVPIGGHHEQTLVRLRGTATGLRRESFLKCRFVSLIGEAGW